MNVADTMSRRSAERPEAIAILEGERAITYRALDDAVWRAAAWLAARGIAPGDVVGISLPSSALHLVVVYALARLGAVQVPLAPGQAPALRQSLIDFFGVGAVVGLAGQPPQPGPALLAADPGWLEPGAVPPARGLRARGDAAGWRFILSSGTTRAPKGILYSHFQEAGFQSRVHSTIGEARQGRYLQLIDMSYCYGLRLCMNALGHGATVVIAGTIAAGDFVEVLARQRITHMAAIPVHLQLVAPALAETPRRDLAIAELTVSGAVMPEPLRQVIRRKLTPHLQVKFGANEVGYMTAASPELLSRCPDTIGTAVPDVEVEVVDDRGRPLPAGEIGLLRARGRRFPSAYFRNPEATARAFRDGWFLPGDLVLRDAAGAFYFKGRADDQMNYDGVKIVPTDIEDALLQHPAVVEAAAFALPSDLHQDLPSAAVVLRRPVPVEELLAFCRERLGVRRARRIVILPALPRNAAGKILRRELARMAAETER